jgi:hypothetical protein
MTSNRQSGQGRRSFGLGNQRVVIRKIRRHATGLGFGSKTVLQAAHRPRLGTLENQLFSTNPPDEMLY